VFVLLTFVEYLGQEDVLCVKEVRAIKLDCRAEVGLKHQSSCFVSTKSWFQTPIPPKQTTLIRNWIAKGLGNLGLAMHTKPQSSDLSELCFIPMVVQKEEKLLLNSLPTIMCSLLITFTND
jgi:hypothetical protein